MALNKKPILSKNLLEMKFVKKTKKKLEKEAKIAEVKSMYSNDVGYKVLGESKFYYEKCFNNLENLNEGRMSFNGMNPEIEALMKADEAEKKLKTDFKQPADVSDVKMTSNYKRHRLVKPDKYKQRK
ncbi:M-phase phosphoprotein 6-like [Teleopsis dalmanni]|uniref:M-phase phosphoprotein 6-like n=1 Tax=Teleopsis dalmanni TaxID=139649 RepID=UPI0018CF9FF8|nr:M-phase phosphoprotein 6-like [Teleopsis dalmanni]